jgi:hypothetical protein
MEEGREGKGKLNPSMSEGTRHKVKPSVNILSHSMYFETLPGSPCLIVISIILAYTHWSIRLRTGTCISLLIHDFLTLMHLKSYFDNQECLGGKLDACAVSDVFGLHRKMKSKKPWHLWLNVPFGVWALANHDSELIMGYSWEIRSSLPIKTPETKLSPFCERSLCNTELLTLATQGCGGLV